MNDPSEVRKGFADWIKETCSSKSGEPMMLSWSWRCDPEIWLAKKWKELIEKVKK